MCIGGASTIPTFVIEKEDISKVMSPIEYFQLFWVDELKNLISEQTNLYSTQKTGISINTTKKEIEQMIGIHLRMGIMESGGWRGRITTQAENL